MAAFLKRPRVLILGSGWGGNHLARQLDKRIFDVRVISPANHFLFTPLLPQTAVGTLEFRAVQEPTRTVNGLGAFYQAKARTLDLMKRTVDCEDIFKNDRFKLDWDFLVIATGCKTNTFNTPGVMDREGKEVFFLKHLYHARQIRNRVVECFERAALPGLQVDERNRLLNFVVVGGGPTSCEFISELHDFVMQDVCRWYPDLHPHVKLTLVEAGPRILGNFDQALVKYTSRQFKKRKIDVKTSVGVTGVTCDDESGDDDSTCKQHFTRAQLSDGTDIPFGMMVWSAGLSQVKFVDQAKALKKGPTGRLLVDRFLRVHLDSEHLHHLHRLPGESQEVAAYPSQGSGLGGRVYAIGDCAVNADVPLAPLASVAEQQAEYLAKILNSDLGLGHMAATQYARDADLPPPAKPVPVASFPPFPSFMFTPSRSFRYIARGSMSSMGSFKGLVDMSHIDTPFGDVVPQGTVHSGFLSFLVWHGYYFSKQYSWSNMLLNPMFKLKSMLFGRDISRF